MLYRGEALSALSGQARVKAALAIQMIFQDPYASLNPPSGCAFRLRCAPADDACANSAPDTAGSAHQVRCFHPLTQVA